MILKEIKFQAMRLSLLLILGFFFMACPEVEEDPDIVLPVSNTQFTFIQSVNKLYFGADVESVYGDGELSEVSILWYGNTPQNIPDALFLNDNGMNGDIITNDGLYTLKISNDTSSVSNTLDDDSGYVYIDFIAVYQNETVIMPDSFRMGNIIPRIVSVFAPDTIVRPPGNGQDLHTISVEAFDVDGLNTIQTVGFTSYHVEGDSMLASGNLIEMYDDGSEVNLCPDFSQECLSGDSLKNDGTFSITIAIYGPDHSQQTTKTGTFKWGFIAIDQMLAKSNKVMHEVIVE